MTWRDFDLQVRGYFLRLARQKWMMREIIFYMIAIETPHDKTPPSRKEIMLLPWDEPEPAQRQLTLEEVAEISDRFERGKLNSINATMKNGSN